MLRETNEGPSVAQLVKNLLAMQETWVPSLGWEDPLEKGKATHLRQRVEARIAYNRCIITWGEVQCTDIHSTRENGRWGLRIGEMRQVTVWPHSRLAPLACECALESGGSGQSRVCCFSRKVVSDSL